MSRKKGKREDQVTRFSKLNYERIKRLMPDKSLNEAIGSLLDTAEMQVESETVYLVQNVVYEDAAVARGQAIMDAARFRQEIQWPKIAIVIGADKI